jgi:hypothetical protein
MDEAKSAEKTVFAELARNLSEPLLKVSVGG